MNIFIAVLFSVGLLSLSGCSKNGTAPVVKNPAAENPKNVVVQFLLNGSFGNAVPDQQGNYYFPFGASQGFRVQLEAPWPLSWKVDLDGASLHEQDRAEPGTFHAGYTPIENRSLWTINVDPPTEKHEKGRYTVALRNVSIDEKKYPPGTPGHESEPVTLNVLIGKAEQPIPPGPVPVPDPPPPIVEGYRFLGRPDCATGTRDEHPGVVLRHDSQGYFCCEPSTGANSPRCGGQDKHEFPCDCRGLGITAQLIQPGGCYEKK